MTDRRVVSSRRRKSIVALEALEHRQMLSVDLNGSGVIPGPGDSFNVLAGETIVGGYGVSNINGTTNYGGGAKAGFYLSTDQTLDGGDVLLATKSIPGIKAHMIVLKPQTVNLTFPTNLAGGTYYVITKVDSENKIAESNENNNTAPSFPFTVAARTRDLTVDIESLKLPPAIVSGALTKGSVSVEINNPGGLALNNGQKVNLQIIASPLDDSDPVVLSTTEVNVSKLDEKKTKKVTVPITLPTNLPADEYEIIAVIDSSNAVTESNEANNSDAANDYTLVSGPIFTDMAIVDFDTDLGGSARTNDKGKATAVLQNKGNIDINGSAELTIVAVPTGEGDPIEVGTFDVSGKIKAGALSKVLKTDFTIPETLTAGTYTFRLVASGFTGFTDSNADNNTLDSTPNVVISKGASIVGKLGTTMTLTRVGLGTVTPLPLGLSSYSEDGTFVDSLGNTGIYAFTTIPKSSKANLVITLVPKGGQTIEDIEILNLLVSFKSRPSTMNGLTINFKKPGESGDATFQGLMSSFPGKMQKGVIDIL